MLLFRCKIKSNALGRFVSYICSTVYFVVASVLIFNNKGKIQIYYLILRKEVKETIQRC